MGGVYKHRICIDEEPDSLLIFKWSTSVDKYDIFYNCNYEDRAALSLALSGTEVKSDKKVSISWSYEYIGKYKYNKNSLEEPDSLVYQDSKLTHDYQVIFKWSSSEDHL